ncbi:YecR family lipoprotein [Entomohabitans teleogrylli]|uniref:YecR family lipoprotein n=1 Tax=Entomohabitans teleogrylli TaxID=1384589 RepID=UPI00073D8A4E|nr:YecR family lipoprotein [Entomohabitans teleogrylli]
MKHSFLAVAIMLLSACSVEKTPVYADGSPLTGVVRLQYSRSPLQRPQVDEYLARSTAALQCHKWGFADARDYGRPLTTCSTTSGSLCLTEIITLEYQCLGIGAPAIR